MKKQFKSLMIKKLKNNKNLIDKDRLYKRIKRKEIKKSKLKNKMKN